MPPVTKKLHGTGVALVTPFHRNGTIDYNALTRLVDHIIRGKCDYLVPLGTTGESVTLNDDEKQSVIDCVIDANRGRLPVVIGLGGNNTASLVRQIERIETIQGIAAVLSVSPYYSKPSQRGLVAHYRTLAKASPLPLLLYNVPGRTGVNMTADTTLELAETCDNIVGIKEASGNMDQILRILMTRPAGFMVISGDDALTLPLMSCGAEGVISVIANAFPKETSGMVNAVIRNRYTEARKWHNQLFPLVPMLFEEGSPSGIKCALEALGVTGSTTRLPIVQVSPALRKRIQSYCLRSA